MGCRRKKGPSEIKLTIPVDDGGAGNICFDYALEVVTAFDNIITNNPQYTFTDDTLITNYQNHVLNNADYKIYWSEAIKDNSNWKNDDDTFKPGTFKKSTTVSLTMLPLLVSPLLPVTAFSIA